MSNEEFPFTTPEGSDARMFIQWKSTDVCMDFYCECGAHVHGDGYFAYNVECGACGAFYQLGTQVIAKKIDEPDGACLYLADNWPDNTPPEIVTLPDGQEATVIATVAEGKVLWAEEPPRLATGGFIEGPPTPITIDLRREQIFTADEVREWTQKGALAEFRRVILNNPVKPEAPNVDE